MPSSIVEETKARVADDVERAKATHHQKLTQLVEQMKQTAGPAGVSIDQAWANERDNLVRHFVGKKAFPNPRPGRTTAQEGDPYYGQETDTIFASYGENRRTHEQHIREGWMPVVDKATGEHVSDRNGTYLYQRSILFRKAQEKAMAERRREQMAAADVPNALNNATLREGVAFDETTITNKGG